MTEYIDREDIRREMFVTVENVYEQGWNDGLKALYISAPIASIRENVFARWKKVAIGRYACSFCSKEPYYNGNIEEYKYCPYCGAFMKWKPAE